MKLFRFAVAVLFLCVAMVGAGQASAEETWVFTTFAGVGPGAADGVGAGARFYIPNGAAVAPGGDIFIADSGNHTIRRITPSGVVTTFAGLAGTPGSADGKGRAARFDEPQDVAVDHDGNVYVADAGNFTIRKIAPDAVVTTLAGIAGSSGSLDGPPSKAQFRAPVSVAVDLGGNVYVADASDHTIRKVTPGGVVSTLAGSAGTSGSDNGTGMMARFYSPQGIEVGPNGNLYVADTFNSMIRRVTPTGTVSRVAGHAGDFGSSDGPANIASFMYPVGIAVDPSGNLLVSDEAGQTIRRVSLSGTVTTIAGLAGAVGGVDGTGSAARFNRPTGIGADAEGNVFVCEFDGYSIRKVTPSGVVTTFAGVSSGGSDDGALGTARFMRPTDVALDPNGGLVVADMQNHTVRRISPEGKVSTIAGQPGTPGDENGAGGAARFFNPRRLAVAKTGEVYVSDGGNSLIRKIATTGQVSTFAGGSGEPGSDDGTGADARFAFPLGVAVDDSGNVFVADTGNSTIRKITPAGVVKTFAGRAGSSQTTDGHGTSARFNGPAGIAVGGDGNIFITEVNGATIRRMTPAGDVTTIAGLAGEPGIADGIGSAARFVAPIGVGVDAVGNLFVSDTLAQTMRKITPGHEVSTIGGTPGYYGWHNGAGSAAQFDSPEGVAVDANGVVYIAEYYSNSIRRGVRCTTGAICALNGRFQLSLSARDPRTGATGEGVPQPRNDVFGYFSIPGLTSNEANPEVFVKMLDGREVNGKFWVFYGGLTDFEYTLTVKDTTTGSTTTYTKPGGSAEGGFDVGGGVTPQGCEGAFHDAVQPAVTPAPCSVTVDALCLNGGRFRVSLTAIDPRTLQDGIGVSVPQDDLFGYFAIPALTGNTGNPEVFVKVLDGRSVNGFFWVFIGGLTDVEYRVTVIDTVTGARKTYDKIGGSACGEFDVDAF